MSAADDRAACERLAAEFDAYQQNTAIAIMTNAAAAKAARLLRAGALAMEQRDECVRLLRVVEKWGGHADIESGLSCNGTWCGEQARALLAKIEQGREEGK